MLCDMTRSNVVWHDSFKWRVTRHVGCRRNSSTMWHDSSTMWHDSPTIFKHMNESCHIVVVHETRLESRRTDSTSNVSHCSCRRVSSCHIAVVEKSVSLFCIQSVESLFYNVTWRVTRHFGCTTDSWLLEQILLQLQRDNYNVTWLVDMFEYCRWVMSHCRRVMSHCRRVSSTYNYNVTWLVDMFENDMCSPFFFPQSVLRKTKNLLHD